MTGNIFFLPRFPQFFILLSTLTVSYLFEADIAWSKNLPSGISGMAAISKRPFHKKTSLFLVVHDSKSKKFGPKLGVLSIRPKDSPRYEPLSMRGWREFEPLNDLESACRIPGRIDEFLVAESGNNEGRKHRIIHFSIKQNETGAWLGDIINVFTFPLELGNYEGLACKEINGNHLQIILGERGNGKPSKLTWLELNLETKRFELMKESWFIAPHIHDQAMTDFRNVSDLYFDSEGNLWISSASDPGDDGPFFSLIYQVDETSSGLKTRKNFRLDGLKVEAITSCPLKNCELSVGTDDENYGGIWRGLQTRSKRAP